MHYITKSLKINHATEKTQIKFAKNLKNTKRNFIKKYIKKIIKICELKTNKLIAKAAKNIYNVFS